VVARNLRAIDIWIGEPAYLGCGLGTRMMLWALTRCFAETPVTAVLVEAKRSGPWCVLVRRRLF
jgi:hypothetical protein